MAEQMDEMYAAEFGFLGKLSGPGTWHSYAYRLPAEKLSQLNRSMTALAERSWQLRIRYQPQLEADEVADFVNGTSRPAQNRSRCLALSNRVEVHADGSVSSCKFFPEFIVGNLNDTPMLDLWGGETFTRVRQSMRATGLMPVCSKCILLYLNGE